MLALQRSKEYVTGDDVRKIDWNVTAKAPKPYIKLFEEERELTVLLLIDISRSGDFGTDHATKIQICAEDCSNSWVFGN